MDSKLTKRRLSDFLAYEWILMIVVAVVAIIALEFVYNAAATRLTVGQLFKYYMDEEIYKFDDTNDKVYELLGVDAGTNGKTFSYDVMKVSFENLSSSQNILSVRLSIQEGDAIFTSSAEKESKTERVRVKQIVDEQSVYYLEDLLARAEEYLKTFTVNGDIYNENDYDEAKIRAHFDERTKGDKRYRSESNREEGMQNEIGRVKKLAKEVKDFKTLLSIGEEKGLFYRYTKYAQSCADYPNNENLKRFYDKEISEGRENRIYGINMGALTGGHKNVSEYLKISGTDSAENVVLTLFDFGEYQFDLQFECISFVNTLVREFSDFLG